MESKNTTPGSLTDANAVASGAAVDSGAVNGGGADVLTVQEIEAALGKTFKTKDAALKSIKDTYSYVGTKIEPVKTGTDETVLNEIKNLKESIFYSQNPQYTPYKAVISKISENPADAITTAEFKTMFENLIAFEKTNKTKSVLDTNSRIGQVTDKMSEALQLAKKKSTYTQAKDQGMAALLESMESNG